MNDDAAKREFAAAVTAWFHALPPEHLDFAEALLAAALDEARGDHAQALALARAAYAEHVKAGGDFTGAGP